METTTNKAMTEGPVHNGDASALLQEDREKMHRQMLSSVSHDLKTPLASMIGSLEIYQRMKRMLPEEKRDMLISTALEEAKRLDNFITNILDMAKLESGTIRLNKDMADMQLLVRQCIKRAGEQKQINIKITEPATPRMVRVDSTLMTRVFWLLLDNAIKYGPNENNTINIGYLYLDGYFTFTIHDSGPGVPAERQEEIFDKYTRLKKTDSQSAGTGLGLAVCRAIVRLHDGDIFIRNHQDGGAIFTVKLPMASAA